MIMIVIPAKGGSTRLPNKNMALINGTPMIDFSIAQAKACECADRICVTTDSDEIAVHCEKQGIEVIRRPTSLGGDTPIIDVYRHALENTASTNIKAIIGLQVDHPDRTVSIDDAYAMFREKDVDRLSSTEADGTKNGAHYILSRHFLDTNELRSEYSIIDDCTNIHYQEDLDKAALNLLKDK
jgi:CMP-N-acetylneuraminic acid synthetase